MIEDGEDDEDVTNHSDNNHTTESHNSDKSFPEIIKTIQYKVVSHLYRDIHLKLCARWAILQPITIDSLKP